MLTNKINLPKGNIMPKVTMYFGGTNFILDMIDGGLDADRKGRANSPEIQFNVNQDNVIPSTQYIGFGHPTSIKVQIDPGFRIVDGKATIDLTNIYYPSPTYIFSSFTPIENDHAYFNIGTHSKVNGTVNFTFYIDYVPLA